MITKILGKGAHAVLTLALMLAGTFALGQNANTGEIKGTVPALAALRRLLPNQITSP